jgi:predicted small lipoprotein YifL
MSRTILIFLLLLLTFCLAACGGGPVSAPAAPEPAEVADEPSIYTEDDIFGALIAATEVGGRAYNYHLVLPESWRGDFEVHTDEEHAVSFFYTPSPDRRELILAILAFRESVWEEIQQTPGAGTPLMTMDGTVFVYRQGSGATLSSAEAERFAQMIADVPGVLQSFTAERSED